MRPILMKGHERPLTFLKYNRDGDLLFSCAKDHTPTVWFADNGERLGTYRGHNGAVWCCDVSRDSMMLITGSADQSAKLWNVQTGAQLFTFNFDSPARAVDFAVGDKLAVITTDPFMGLPSAIHVKHIARDPSELEAPSLCRSPLKLIEAVSQSQTSDVDRSSLTSIEALRRRSKPLTSIAALSLSISRSSRLRGKMSSSNSANNTPSAFDAEDDKPLWKYVTRLEKSGAKGGNYTFQCNFCRVTRKGSYTRVKAHLMQIKNQGIEVCPKVTSKDKADFERAIAEAELKLKNSRLKKVPLPPPSSSASLGLCFNEPEEIYGSKRKRSTALGSGSSSNPVMKAFNIGARERLNSEIARMFYSAGLPFHLARNPYYVSAFTFAANNNIQGYVPPGYNMLRTTLLQKERTNIDRLLDPIRGSWREKGVSIVSDGWSDSQRRPLINFMAVTGGGPMFLKAVDCSGETKDKYFISNLMKEVIMEVGPKNVVQVITDNAANCKAAGHLIEAQFPHIFWTPCVVHTLNLALKNICAAKNVENNSVAFEECNWISEIVGDVMMIKNFICNHSMRLAMYNEFVSLKLLSVAETRFASSIVMLKRVKLIKQGLQTMVISDKWSCYRDDDIGKAKFVKDKLLDDFWWDQVDYILSFTAPIYDMIRVCDTDRPSLHLVYDMWDTMIEKVKMVIYKHEGKRLEDESTFYNVVHQILVDRWNKNNTPLHCLAHSLNPRYYSDVWLHEDPSRVPPHRDEEVCLERKKCLKRFFDDPMERTKANLEYAKFSTKEGPFADIDSIGDRCDMDPHSWWVVHGASAPTLQSLALRLLVQPSSSSCAERNWSIYSFIHSMRRNKMTPQRAEDLVFVHSNLRLLSRRTPQYHEGETKLWDIAGDTFDSFDDVGMLEVANLSLDEPEMEVVLFTDDGGANEEKGGDANDDEDVQEIGST